MLLRFPANGSSILQTNIFLKIVKLVVLPIWCCSTFAGLHVTAKELGLGESITIKLNRGSRVFLLEFPLILGDKFD